MDSAWILNEAVFRPAEINKYFGITPGTQNQWASRGLLGSQKRARGEVTLAGAAALLFLQDCSKRKVGLEVASSAIAAVSAAARRYVITSLVPLPFDGNRTDHREYKAWQARNHLLEANLIDAWLGSDEGVGARYVAIEAGRAYPLAVGHLNELEDDDPRNCPISRVVTDCWAIGEAIKSVPNKDLVWVSK